MDLNLGTDAAVVAHLRDMLASKQSDVDIASFCRGLGAPIPASLPSPTTLVRLNDFSIKALFSELFSSYKVLLANYPVRTKAITSSTISMLGEIAGSFIRAHAKGEKVNIDPKRVAIFGSFGLLCTGPMLHFWYVLLDHCVSTKMNLSGRAKTLAKVIIDRCIWGPPYTFFTVCYLTFLQTLSTSAVKDVIAKQYLAILIMSQKVWVPAQVSLEEGVMEGAIDTEIDYYSIFRKSYVMFGGALDSFDVPLSYSILSLALS